MQFGRLGKFVAAGTTAAMMLGSTVALAQLQNFPAPFVEGASAETIVVVGEKALPIDVVAAIDVAARLGGERTTDVTVSGTTGGLSISGEGKEVATTNTKIFLGDSLGKTGVRSTMTKDDMPTLLANGVLDDADASTTHNYQQFIYLTPSSTASANYKLQFEKPGSSSSVDPTYDIGRFPTSPTASDYLYRTYVTFDKEVNGSTSVGEKITLFGKQYTISSGTTGTFAATTADKLVLFGGAISQVANGGETVKATVGGVDYDVTLVGASSATVAVIRVGTDQQSITKSTSKKVGGLDVYVDDVYYLSQNDQTQNSAKLLLGSSKITLQDGSKVKLGDTEDSVDGTLVDLVISSGKLSAMTIYVGGRSSTDDFIKVGGTYTDPVWKSFSIAFPNVVPSPLDGSRTRTDIKPSGDNVLQLTFKDDRGYTKTLDWAYKSASTGVTLRLADNSGNPYIVTENSTIARDGYFLVDSGDFTHLFKLTGVSIDGTSSSNIEITDQFSGVTTKVTLGTDNRESKVIDGQTYYISNQTLGDASSIRVAWGTGATYEDPGTYMTVWPRLKGKNGEFIALLNGSFTQDMSVNADDKIQLPTGAIELDYDGVKQWYNITTAVKEDGTTSALASTSSSTLNLTASADNPSAIIGLGRTTSGVVWYNLSKGTAASSLKIALVGGAAATTQVGNASVILIEERDDSNDQNAVIVTGGVEASGSNQVAIPGAPDYTYAEESATLGTDSTITEYVDLWGTWIRRTTSGQDTLAIYYPDEQVVANLAVLATDASASMSGGETGKTVKSAVPIKTSIAKLDGEVTQADKTTKNLILVGGPFVNKLVAELATNGKTRDGQFYLTQGAGYAVLDYVANAFASGKSALVVAGTSGSDTRAVASKLQSFDTAGLTGSRMEWKNGVVATLPA